MLAIERVEILGYLASLLVIVSLTMRSVVRLRLISLCGSIAFLTYGLLIESTPIVLTNVCIAGINLFFLRREFLVRSEERHDLGVSRIRSDSPFLLDFIEYHLDDIRRFQPDFRLPDDANVWSWMLTRDGLPAGLVIGRRRDDTLIVDLDYVLREHRDSRLGQWLYGPGAEVFRTEGFGRVRSRASTDEHGRYLQRVGFVHVDDTDVHELTL